MVNLAHHHRKIRWKAYLIHLGMVPLALAMPLSWIYFTYQTCVDAETPLVIGACKASLAVPLIPALLGLIALAFIAWDLATLGSALHAETSGHKTHAVRWGHTARGYRGIDPRHRLHVHLAVFQVLLVGAALVFWLFFEAYYTTH